MIFLLNLIGFLIEMIICPILLIPFLIWRLLMNVQITPTESEVETEEATDDKKVFDIASYRFLQNAG